MKKLYYSIGEVSKITEIEPYVLRYWETKFTELSPAKNHAGKRIYTENDINTILKLKVLIREKKYSTTGALHALNDNENEVNAQHHLPVQAIRDLNEIKLFLQDLLKII